MSNSTYYIVQTLPTLFVHECGTFGGHCEGRGAKDAAHLDIHEARRLYRSYKATRSPDTPRRFPRILKVATTITTVNERR